MTLRNRVCIFFMWASLLGVATYTAVGVSRLRTEVEEGIDSLHLLHDQRGTNIYTIQDTLVRIFHYTQPHKGKIDFCPECYKHVEDRKREFSQPFKDEEALKGWSSKVEPMIHIPTPPEGQVPSGPRSFSEVKPTITPPVILKNEP
jgi:hypothetical protein